jgi:hypothetical protein
MNFILTICELQKKMVLKCAALKIFIYNINIDWLFLLHNVTIVQQQMSHSEFGKRQLLAGWQSALFVVVLWRELLRLSVSDWDSDLRKLNDCEIHSTTPKSGVNDHEKCVFLHVDVEKVVIVHQHTNQPVFIVKMMTNQALLRGLLMALSNRSDHQIRRRKRWGVIWFSTLTSKRPGQLVWLFWWIEPWKLKNKRNLMWCCYWTLFGQNDAANWCQARRHYTKSISWQNFEFGSSPGAVPIASQSTSNMMRKLGHHFDAAYHQSSCPSRPPFVLHLFADVSPIIVHPTRDDRRQFLFTND